MDHNALGPKKQSRPSAPRRCQANNEVCIAHCSFGWTMTEAAPSIYTCSSGSLTGGKGLGGKGRWFSGGGEVWLVFCLRKHQNTAHLVGEVLFHMKSNSELPTFLNVFDLLCTLAFSQGISPRRLIANLYPSPVHLRISQRTGNPPRALTDLRGVELQDQLKTMGNN